MDKFLWNFLKGIGNSRLYFGDNLDYHDPDAEIYFTLFNVTK